ncbi:PAS domain S-box protein [bacterium]|nr:PAS domain S-box protein [bacterium]
MIRANELWRYGIAALVVSAALGLQLAAEPIIGSVSPPLFFAAAVAAAAWYGGLGPGMLATLLGAAAGAYFFVPPVWRLAPTPGEIAFVIGFLLEGAFITWIVVRLQSASREAQAQQEALRESEELFRATFEQAAVGMAHTALDGRLLRVNGRFADILGFTRDELMERSFQAITHPDDLASNVDLARRLAAGEFSHYTVEKRYTRKDGGTVWANLTSSIRRSHAGRPLHYIAVIEDISERKRAEEAVRAAERQLRDLLDNLFVFVGLLDPDGTVRWVNRPLLVAGGLTLEQVIGRAFWDCPWWTHDPAACDRVRAAVQAAAGGRPARFDETIRAAADGRMVIDFQVAFLRGEDGAVRYILPSAVDITDRKRAEAERADRETRLQVVLDTAADAIITIDHAGTILTVNRAVEAMFGYTVGELVGQNVRMLMPPPFSVEHDTYITRYLATGEARIIGTGREAIARRKDGSVFPIELAISEINHLRQFTGIVRDVTRRKELEREVVEIASLEQRRIGQDLHDTVGQELTALNILAGDLADAVRTDPDAAARLAGRVAGGLRRCQRELRVVIRGLLPVPVDAEGLMAALADLADRTRSDARVACTFDCPDPVAVADNLTATQLYLIAQEAVHNAVKHARPRAVRIALCADHGLVLRVEDDGAGLPAGRSGLGLRIMHDRAAIIGARLTIGPASPAGTSVTCELPGGSHGQE